MSDQNPATAPAEAPAVNPVVANAAQVLAMKELGETVAGVKGSIKKLWISFGVLAVVVVILAVMTLVPSLRFGMMGGQRGTFNRGQFTNGTFQGPAGGGTGGTTNGGAPAGNGTVPTP